MRLVVERMALSHDGIAMQEFFELWRAWQQGSRPWREPWVGHQAVIRANSDKLRAGVAVQSILCRGG